MTRADWDTPPADWTCFPWPVGWGTNAFSVVQVGLAAFPRRFLFAVRTPDMGDGAILLDFAAQPGSVSLSSVLGAGIDLAVHLTEVIEAWPPTGWGQHAKREIVQFLVDAHFGGAERVKAIEAEALALLAAIETPGTGAPPSGGLRRRLTAGHLEDAARVYREALADGRPPTRAVQHHFEVSHSTAAKWIGHARKQGLIPPATNGKVGA